MKRPMILFALIASMLTIFGFYERKLVLIFTVLLIISSFVIIFFKKFTYLVPLFLCVVIMINMLNTYSKIDKVNLLSKSVITEDFVITADSKVNKKYSETDIKCVSGKVLPKGTELSSVYYGKETFNAGDIVNLSVKLSPAKRNFMESNYGNGVYYESYIKKINYYGEYDIFYKMLGKIRQYIINTDLSFLKGDTAGVLIAITIGDKGYISNELYSAVKTVGVSHMMAVSGLHLAILLGSFFALINKKFKNKYLRFSFSLLLVLLFTGVCGFTKSIIRAGLMFVISSAAPLLNRESDSLNSLGTSVLLILCVSPFAALSIALKLSVLATFAIVYLSPFYKNLFLSKIKLNMAVFDKTIGIVFDTVFATIITLPVIIKYFGTVSLVSVIANLLLNLLVTLALIFNAVSLLIPDILFFIKYILFKIAGFFSYLMRIIISALSKVPFASVNMGKTVFIVSIVFIIALIVFTDILRYKQKKIRRDNV